MAYVPEMNEDEYLGDITPYSIYRYFINGQLVNRETYFNKLNEISKSQLEPINKRLEELYKIQKEIEKLEEERRKLRDKIAKDNNFEIRKAYLNSKGRIIKEEKIF